MSKKINMEWLLPICDYSDSLKKNERAFEKTIPLILSIIAVAVCFFKDISKPALNNLNDLLPNVLAVLIGFTISTIAIIISTTDSPEALINKKLDRIINGKQITFKQWFLTNLVYYTISEITFIILTFIFPLINFIFNNPILRYISIGIYCYLLLSNLFGIVKILTKMYLVFFKEKLS